MPKLKPEGADGAAGAYSRCGRALLCAHRLPPHDHARHLQGGGRQPRRALRLFRQQGGADRRHLRARRAGSPSGSTGSRTRPISCRRCASWASGISRRSRPTVTACASRSGSVDAQPRIGEIHQRIDRYILELPGAVPENEGRGPHRPDLPTSTVARAFLVVADGMFWRRAVDPTSMPKRSCRPSCR